MRELTGDYNKLQDVDGVQDDPPTKEERKAERSRVRMSDQKALQRRLSTCGGSYKRGFIVGRKLALAGVFAHWQEAYKAFSDTESYYNDPAASQGTRYCKGFREGYDYVASGMEAELGELVV